MNIYKSQVNEFIILPIKSEFNGIIFDTIMQKSDGTIMFIDSDRSGFSTFIKGKCINMKTLSQIYEEKDEKIAKEIDKVYHRCYNYLAAGLSFTGGFMV